MKKCLHTKLNNASYTVLGCSVKGARKEFNQDAFLIDCNDSCIVCLLADGLGSAINSEIGAQTVCKVAMDIIASQGFTKDFPYLLKKRWSDSLAVKPISADTTFKFIVINKDEIVYGGIGDGWIVGVVDGRFFEHKSHNHFSNQTDSMMSVGYEDRFELNILPYKEIQILSLATDGFSEDIKSESTASFIQECLSEMNNNADEFLTTLEQMIENWPIKTNQDDKTIVLVGVTNE